MDITKELMKEMEKLNRKVDTLLSMIRSLPVKSAETLDDWLNEDQTKELLGYSTTSLWSLRRTNKLKFSKIGGKTFYSKQSIIDYLKKNEKK